MSKSTSTPALLHPQWIFLVAAVFLIPWLSGCTTQTTIPVTGLGSIIISEYALVEQSADNPTHSGFQDRVPAAVNAQRFDWPRASASKETTDPNRILNPLGYHLATNPVPPFSAYALYQGDRLVQVDILHIWPVTTGPDGGDFALPFETLDGQLLVATQTGVNPWSSTTSPQSSNSSLAGQRLAMAGGVEGSGIVLDLPQSETVSQAPAGRYEATFGHQNLGGRPFYFFIQDGMTGLSFDGSPLAYNYDQVIHGASGPAAIFNPGGNDQIVWFYALRDGLWYYVELGVSR